MSECSESERLSSSAAFFLLPCYLKGQLWRVDWNGEGLASASATTLMTYSYWVDPSQNSQDHFAVSPDGRNVAFETQTIVEANIDMIENVR